MQLGHSGPDYETLAELVADVRTIEAQMASPRPKADIVRASLTSLLMAAKDWCPKDWQRSLEDFLA